MEVKAGSPQWLKFMFKLGDLVRYSKHHVVLKDKSVGKIVGWRRTTSGRKYQFKVYWGDGTMDWYSAIWLEKIEKDVDKAE